MNFHNLQTLVGSLKSPVEMSKPIPSFRVAAPRERPYIEPDFSKVLFDTERPQVLLVSAVGATGKSALAQVLSARLELPLLDLGKHKPIGDNTLTGLLHSAFSMDRLGPVFHGLASGSYGVIVDGIDEGRSKTHEQAFNAFLDDIAKLCSGSPATSFVLLGRTNVVEGCWTHLIDKGLTIGVLQIEPFDLRQARSYIDRFTTGVGSGQAAQYEAARDAILGKLSTAFTSSPVDRSGSFLSFIGYPPVLDAIVTLLCEERNYHRLKERLEEGASKNVEIELLYKIASYILDRERNEKVIPNFVAPLLKELPQPVRSGTSNDIFSAHEQCVRLVAHCIDSPVSLQSLPDPVLNARYEEQLGHFLPEHPFLTGKEFRNAIFEAAALALLMSSMSESDSELVLSYLENRRHSYYVIYLLDIVAPEKRVPLPCLPALLGAALEFRANNTSVEMQILGSDPDDAQPSGSVDLQVDLSFAGADERPKGFEFHCPWSTGVTVNLGSRLASAYILVPGSVVLGGASEIELTAPVELRTARLELRADTLTIKSQGAPAAEKHIILEAESIMSNVTTICGSGADLTLVLGDAAGLHYPLVKHVTQRTRPPQDPALLEKYLRFRKILTHFRSHSKGALAKYRDKIENPRVAGNRVGSAVLNRLLGDGVLVVDGPLYFLDQARVEALLGISWTDLRNGQTTEKLLAYLRSIDV